MLFVFLRALCNTLFAQLLRLGQAKRPQTLGVITINYGVATLASLVLAVFHRHAHYLPPTLALGALGGVAYIVSILLFMPAMRRSGVSVAVAVLQLAILWPVAYAMLVFGEMPSPAQWVGMGAAVAALVLLSAAAVFERGTPSVWTSGTVFALGYLALVGTFTFLGSQWLIPRLPVAVVGTFPILNTLLALLWGSLLGHERITARAVAGGALILSGVTVTVRTRAPSAAAPAAEG